MPGHCGLKGIGDGVFAPPNLRVGRELRLRRERTAEFAVVAIEIETRAERVTMILGFIIIVSF